MIVVSEPGHHIAHQPPPLAASTSDDWTALAHWDGSWILRGAQHGTVRAVIPPRGGLRLRPATAGGEPIGSWGEAWGLSSSADGRRLAWWGRWNGDGRFSIAEPAGIIHIPPPEETVGARLTGDGSGVLYRERTGDPWRVRPVDGREEASVAAGTWDAVVVAADGSLGAVSMSVEEGRLCVAPGGRMAAR